MELQIIWFFLWGLLWALFFITDGFDFGIGTLLPFLGKTNNEKRTMLNTLGPLWDGNEVWLITAGGVTFAAFPLVYAVMFSSLYSALMLILFALIFRGVAIEFRNKVEHPEWRFLWDAMVFLGSAAPAILFGVVFANIFKGIPFDGDLIYRGTLFSLFNFYGVLGGLLFLLLFLVHGSVWLAFKTTGALHERSVKAAKRLWPVLLVVAAGFLIASAYETSLYDNYKANPVLFVFVLAAVAALIATRLFISKRSYFKAWVASAVSIAGCTFFGVIGLFPNLFPSSVSPEHSLTAYNASSSPLTLKIMLIVTIILIPIVICYQGWAYKLFSDKEPDAETMPDAHY